MNTPNTLNKGLLANRDLLLIDAKKILHWELANKTPGKVFAKLTMYDRLCDSQNIEVASEIRSAINLLSQRFQVPPVVTYECLILLNDLENSPSLFSEEYIEDEALFYKTHQDIEYLFFEIHEMVFDFYSWNLKDISIESMLSNLWLINKKLHTLMSTMKGRAFNSFRPYWDLTEHYRKDENANTYPGPSGAYTCSFVYMDMLLWIRDHTITNYSMDDRMLPNITWFGYITKHELDTLKLMIKDKGSLSDILWESTKWIISLKQSILKFRFWHKQAAKKYIWDENLERPWTGASVNANDFLDEHIDATKKSIARNI